MNRTVSQTAQILGVDGQQVKSWAWLFKDILGTQANPGKGRAREFTDSDVFALMYVVIHWEDRPDIEAIRSGLNCGDQFEDPRFRKILYSHTRLLQEPPVDLGEPWRHGISPSIGVDADFELARSFRQSADALLKSALQSGEPGVSGVPVLFTYRHALELYLKILGDIKHLTHSLEDCLNSVERRLGSRISLPIRGWIIELGQIDPKGTAFRYADDQAGTLRYSEYWIDLDHVKHAMTKVFDALDWACLDFRSGALERTA
jgi:hypothetical protein